MLEKPDLADEKIIASLQDSYGLPFAGLEFLPIGNDSSAWVYRVQTDEGTPYFLKVKKGAVYEPSLAIPRYLKDSGIEQVVAPLPTHTQQLWASVDQFALILYPFIDGGTGMETGMSDRQWIEFGAVLQRIHATQLSAELLRLVRRETFTLKWKAVLHQLQARLRDGAFDDPFQKEVASFWKDRHDEIQQIVDRTEALGRLLQNKSLNFVLCHADIHTFNLLIDQASNMHIVDWDDTLLAPRERDLMFVRGAVAGSTDGVKEEALFFEGYGNTEVDPVAIAFYRFEWVVQEIADYGQRVFLMRELGEETRQDAVRGLIQLFDPGDVVEEAYESEMHLPPDLQRNRA